jgi:hypothetical protein
LECHRGLDLFPTPDLRYLLLVGEDGLTTVLEQTGEDAERREARFVFGDADGPAINGLPDDFYRETFERFDPEGRGFHTLTVDSLLSFSTGGDVTYQYVQTERLRAWDGTVLDSTTSEAESVRALPSVPPRPGETLFQEHCLTERPWCAEIVEKTIVVWDTLAAGSDVPDVADALRTFDLYERGEHVEFAPSGRFILGVTVTGRAKIWALEETFDPEQFVERYDATLRTLTPDELRRFRIAD